jgi:hypothetical protein
MREDKTMPGDKNQHWGVCAPVVAATPVTITIEQIQVYLRITNATGNVLYIVFDWVTGETEVSATNYDIVLANNAAFELARDNKKRVPKIGNLRVLSAGSGDVSVWGW